jgi:kinetochore protein NNF1
MAQQRSRSQSPLPPPPEELAPGRRATALQAAITGALDATLKKCSYENFAACFPTTAKYQPETLEGFWKDFLAKLGGSCTVSSARPRIASEMLANALCCVQNEFNDILATRAVIPSLNSLDRLVADAKVRKEAAEAATPDGKAVEPVPPHVLPATDILTAHLSPFLLEQHKALTTALDTIEKSNETLAETITTQRDEMEKLVKSLEAVVGDLERSAAMLQSEDVQALGGEVRGIEAALKG